MRYNDFSHHTYNLYLYLLSVESRGFVRIELLFRVAECSGCNWCSLNVVGWESVPMMGVLKGAQPAIILHTSFPTVCMSSGEQHFKRWNYHVLEMFICWTFRNWSNYELSFEIHLHPKTALGPGLNWELNRPSSFPDRHKWMLLTNHTWPPRTIIHSS